MTDHLHEQIRRVRRQRGMRQSDLAARAGIATASVTRIEHGDTDPQESSLEALAHGLDAEILLIPRAHVPEVLKILGLKPAAADPGVGSAFDDVFIPDPPEDDHG